MTTDSNEEGVRVHAEFAQSTQLETIEQMMEQERFLADLDRLPNERRFVIIDETWRPRPYQLELIEQLERRFRLVNVVEHDPRPIKGKFEPQHSFNSRLRAWLRRNP